MRLFGKVDGTVDRYDRVGWLSPPFDLAFGGRAVATARIHPDPGRSAGHRTGPDPGRSAGHRTGPDPSRSIGHVT